MRHTVFLGTLLLAVLSLILALPIAAITNHLLGFEGFSLGRMLWLNLSLGALILLLIGSPVAAAMRRRRQHEAARSLAVPAQATIVAVKDVPVQSKRRGVRLTLDVSLPDGARQRTTTGTWLVRKADADRLQPGAMLEVKVDPSRPEHVFPNCDWLSEA